MAVIGQEEGDEVVVRTNDGPDRIALIEAVERDPSTLETATD